MKCTILHEGKGRMRVHVEKVRMTLHRADVLEAYLNHNDAIVHAAVYERTGDVVITYTGRRAAAIAVLAGYKFDVAGPVVRCAAKMGIHKMCIRDRYRVLSSSGWADSQARILN